jgi:DNA-binding NtrC family response regulator
MVAQLVADRFLVVRQEEGIDLGTGERVWLRPVTPGSRLEQDAWLCRCAALSGFWHPHVVSLVDYGAVGRSGFFEAWASPAAPVGWRGRDAATARAVGSAVNALVSRSLTVGSVHWRHIIDLSGQPAFLPTDATGFALDGDGVVERGRCVFELERLLSACPPPVVTHGLAAIGAQPDDRAVEMAAGNALELAERLGDVLEGGVSGRPRAVRVSVPGGALGRLVRRAMARLARLHGYVPVTTALLDAGTAGSLPPVRWRPAIENRHVLVLDAGSRSAEASPGAALFVHLGSSSDRPHVLMRLDEPSLPTAERGTSAMREPSANYVATGAGQRHGQSAWPQAPACQRGELDTRAKAIAEAAERGRHALAERLLRETMGRCARRHDEAAAAQSALALGRLLLVRGQPAEAGRMLERARLHFDRARCATGALRAAVYAGLAWTDEGRLRDAESALRAVRIAAADVSEPGLEEFATLAIARCLYWQERFAEAWDCLTDSDAGSCGPAELPADGLAHEWTRLGRATCARERLHGAPVAPGPLAGLAACWSAGTVGLDVARQCLASRISLAIDDVAGAGRFAAEARERAGASANPTELAAACCAKASVYAIMGDVSAVRAQVGEGIEAARLAHAPLRALRLRVVLADALRRAGKSAEAGALRARLARLNPANLPKVVGLPLERVIRGDAQRPVARGGIMPFPLVREPESATFDARASAVRPAVIDTVVEVLGICQSAADETTVLQRVTAVLRERVRAASVVCFGRDRDLILALAADGGRARAEDVARRAIEAGLPIAPTATTSGLEAAAPIKFAGACVGALGCRWAADSPPDWPVVCAVLATASAAVAPCVRAELDRRFTPAEPARERAGELVGVSDTLENLRREIGRAARAPFNVVIEGESGSGKELVARGIHGLGPRRHGPLCALNCAALTDELVEAELFGHARGAFTGAVTERKGLFEAADGGILVLDEVGELSARAQAKLLRAIQEGQVRRVGENFTRSVDVRIVAATNRCLRAAVEAGVFRCDLRYRLEVIRIVVPPLRAHAEDIPVLASHFWREAAARVESRCTLAPETLAALARYDWPGNVRELQNVMAALAAAVGSRGSVGPEHLPAVIAGQATGSGNQNLEEARRTFESRFVRAALARAGGRRALAATDLGLTRQGLTKLMARLGISLGT